MSRRLIIAILILLILGIIGGTAALIIQRLRPKNSSLSNSETSSSLLPSTNPTGDDDHDGLSNADEATWGSNPALPDTDGDGFKDGEEVLARHNPTIAGPDDKLPDGFTPGQGVPTPTGDIHLLTVNDIIDLNSPLPSDLSTSPIPLTVDQYFDATVDLSGGKINLTEQYLKQSKNSYLTNAVVPFIQNQPIITKLPTTYESLIKTQTSENTTSIRNYAAEINKDNILGDQNGFESALLDLFQNNDTNRITETINSLATFQQTLLKLAAPPSEKPLHRLILGYTELLKATLQNYLLEWNTDRIKALVGIRQLDAADRLYYPLIQTELNRLNSL